MVNITAPMKCLATVTDVQVLAFATVVIRGWIAPRVDPLTFYCGPTRPKPRTLAPKKSVAPTIAVVVGIVILPRVNVCAKFGERGRPVKRRSVRRTTTFVCGATRSDAGNVRKGISSIPRERKTCVGCVLNLIPGAWCATKSNVWCAPTHCCVRCGGPEDVVWTPNNPWKIFTENCPSHCLLGRNAPKRLTKPNRFKFLPRPTVPCGVRRWGAPRAWSTTVSGIVVPSKRPTKCVATWVHWRSIHRSIKWPNRPGICW